MYQKILKWEHDIDTGTSLVIWHQEFGDLELDLHGSKYFHKEEIRSEYTAFAESFQLYEFECVNRALFKRIAAGRIKLHILKCREH